MSDPNPGSRRILQSLWAPLVCYAVFRCVLEVVRVPGQPPAMLLGLAFALASAGSIALPIWLLAALVRRGGGAGQAALYACVGLAAWMAAGALPSPLGALGADLGKVLLAGNVGILLARLFREPNLLLPAGLFAAFADYVVVTRGTVHQALSTPKGAEFVKGISAGVPAVHPSLPSLTIGPADFLFLGFFLGCALMFGWGLRRNALVLAAVLGVSLILVPLVDRVPALAPMGLAFLLLNRRSFRLTRVELIGSVLVLVLAGGLFWGYFALLSGGGGR